MGAEDVGIGRNPVTNGEIVNIAPNFNYGAGKFMAGNEGEIAHILPPVNVQIGAADTGLGNLHDDLVRAAYRVRHLLDGK